MIVILFLLVLVVIYLYYHNQPGTSSSSTQSSIPNVWSDPVQLEPCMTYTFAPQNVNGIWLTKPSLGSIEGLPAETPGKCFQSNQIVARKLRRTCISKTDTPNSSSNCYLQTGGIADYGGSEDFYEQCITTKMCPGVLASISFSNQQSCNDVQRKCLSYSLQLQTCNPSQDLMQIIFYDSEGKQRSDNKPTNFLSIQQSSGTMYLSEDLVSGRLVWSNEKFIWTIKTENRISRLYGKTGYISSLDGQSTLILDSAFSGYWQAFQYLNLELYNVILKSANCPCNGCFDVVPS